MTIGQLLFGWAARGSEGVDRQQIIAASGRLGDRAQVATQIVLRYCYRPDSDAFGWVERQGVQIVFMRTLTGVDGSGRPGAFLVHALVCRPGTLPREVLGRLWSAGVWHRKPPSELIELPALKTIEELRLGDRAAVDEQTVEASLTGYLANAAAGRRSAIPGDEAVAVATAARVVELLPSDVELPSFSTYETEQARLYDLLAGRVPTELFAPLRPSPGPGDLWADAARLLVDAGRDEAAAAAVEAATTGIATAPEAAERLYSCVAVVRAAGGDGPVDARSLELAASDPRFAGWLVDRAGMEWVGQPFVDGNRHAATFVGAAAEDGRGERIADLTPAIAAASLEAGIEVLLELDVMAVELAPTIARRVVETWSRHGRLDALRPSDGVTLLRVLASRGGQPGRAGDLLLSMPSLTSALAGATGLAVRWRAQAVALNPEAIDPPRLASLAAHEPGFARDLLRHGRSEVVDAVSRAIASADVDTARLAAAAAAAHADDATADDWRWLALARLPAPERHAQMLALARATRRLAVRHAEALLDAYVETVGALRPTRLKLPQPPRIRVASGSTRVDTWLRFGRLQERLRRAESSRSAGEAASLAVRLRRPEDADAALELTFDSCTGAPTEGIWADAVGAAHRLSGEPAAACAARLIGSALRVRSWSSATLSSWVALWIARRIDDGSLDVAQLSPEAIAALATTLGDDQARDDLLQHRKSLGRRGGKWLKKLTSTPPRRR